MEDLALREKLIDTLLDVAPDIADRGIDEKALLQEQYNLDSADFLSYIIKIHDRFGIDVPVEDYGSFSTIEGAVDYLRAHIVNEKNVLLSGVVFGPMP